MKISVILCRIYTPGVFFDSLFCFFKIFQLFYNQRQSQDFIWRREGQNPKLYLSFFGIKNHSLLIILEQKNIHCIINRIQILHLGRKKYPFFCNFCSYYIYLNLILLIELYDFYIYLSNVRKLMQIVFLCFTLENMRQFEI